MTDHIDDVMEPVKTAEMAQTVVQLMQEEFEDPNRALICLALAQAMIVQTCHYLPTELNLTRDEWIERALQTVHETAKESVKFFSPPTGEPR